MLLCLPSALWIYFKQTSSRISHRRRPPNTATSWGGAGRREAPGLAWGIPLLPAQTSQEGSANPEMGLSGVGGSAGCHLALTLLSPAHQEEFSYLT